MKSFKFTKMVASGNDFVIVDSLQFKAYLPIRQAGKLKLENLAKSLCNRRFGIGADGLLLVGRSRKAGIEMRIFNADGSEAQMCGNGARCVALWESARRKTPNAKLNIETKAGVIHSEVRRENVRIRLTDPKDLKLNIPVKVNNRTLKVNFINTGVPHAVIFVNGLENIDVDKIGRQVRFHKKFAPKGANVNFVEILSDNFIRVRTYERGVEGETLACGTGSAASALITAYNLQLMIYSMVNVKTRGGEILKVYFDKCNGAFKNIWLEGKAGVVYKGEYNV